MKWDAVVGTVIPRTILRPILSPLNRKVFLCLTGPYLTRRVTFGRLANPPLAEGGSLETPLSGTPTSITAYTARGSSD